MPTVTMDELENWIERFREKEQRVSGSLRAIDSTWDRTNIDTSLVFISLESVDTEVYLRREVGVSPIWSITMLPRTRAVTMDSTDALELATEVGHVAHLCDFLTERTQEHLLQHA